MKHKEREQDDRAMHQHVKKPVLAEGEIVSGWTGGGIIHAEACRFATLLNSPGVRKSETWDMRLATACQKAVLRATMVEGGNYSAFCFVFLAGAFLAAGLAEPSKDATKSVSKRGT